MRLHPTDSSGRQSGTTRPALVLVAAALLAGCASNTFSLSYPDNDPAMLAKALTRIQARPIAPINGAPMVYVVTQKPTTIVAFDLRGTKVVWKAKGSVTSRIVVGQGRLYHTANNRALVARDAKSGKALWRVALLKGSRLLGVATDKGRVYYAAEATSRIGGDGAAGYVVAIDAGKGEVVWKRPSSGRIGAPAARDGLVFVPLRYQSISVLEGKKGEEIARVRSKEEVLLWVRSMPDGVYFGGKTGVYALDPKAVSGTRRGATFIAAALPASVRPAYWWNGYNAALSGYTAYDRNRLLWRARRLPGEGPIGFGDDAIYVHNYRFFFAFEGAAAKAGRDKLSTPDPRAKSTKGARGKAAAVPMASGGGKGKATTLEGGEVDAAADEKSAEPIAKLKWAYSFPRNDVVASYHSGKSLVLVSVKGDVVILDLESGLPASSTALKLAVRGATFDALGFAPPTKPRGTPNLERTLTEMIWDPDRRFGEVKLFGIQQLSKLSGAKVADALVQIVTRPGINPKVYKRAGDMIVARHDKSAIPLYLKVLRNRYSFIDGTRPQAVDIMARALGDLKAPEAVQPLLAHLGDHETPIKAIAPIVKALAAIGDGAAVEPLRDFLLTYRCEPQFKKAPEALNALGDALLALGGEEERQLLRFVGNDAHTLKSLKVYLKAALRQDKLRPRKKPAKPAKVVAKTAVAPKTKASKGKRVKRGTPKKGKRVKRRTPKKGKRVKRGTPKKGKRVKRKAKKAKAK